MRLHIAVLSVHDPADVSKWSGTPYHMVWGFRQAGLEVSAIGPLRWHWSKLYDWKWKIYKRLGKNYSHVREPKVLRTFGEQGSRLVAGITPAPEAVICTGSWQAAHLKTNKPVILWTDATFGGMLKTHGGVYPEYTNLCRESLRHGHNCEQAALERCTLAVF